MGSSKCYRARWIAVVSSSFRVGDTWGREKGCREAEISAPLASLEDEEPATVSCARGCRLQFITLLGGAAAVVSLTRPRFCAADRGTDNHRSRSMTCARDNPGCRGTNSVSCRDIEIHRRWLFALGAQSVAAHSC